MIKIFIREGLIAFLFLAKGLVALNEGPLAKVISWMRM